MAAARCYIEKIALSSGQDGILSSQQSHVLHNNLTADTQLFGQGTAGEWYDFCSTSQNAKYR